MLAHRRNPPILSRGNLTPSQNQEPKQEAAMYISDFHIRGRALCHHPEKLTSALHWSRATYRDGRDATSPMEAPWVPRSVHRDLLGLSGVFRTKGGHLASFVLRVANQSLFGALKCYERFSTAAQMENHSSRPCTLSPQSNSKPVTSG